MSWSRDDAAGTRSVYIITIDTAGEFVSGIWDAWICFPGTHHLTQFPPNDARREFASSIKSAGDPLSGTVSLKLSGTIRR